MGRGVEKRGVEQKKEWKYERKAETEGRAERQRHIHYNEEERRIEVFINKTRKGDR